VNRGDRVEFIGVTDDNARLGLSADDRGTVDFTYSLGPVHVRWDSGSRVGITASELDLIRSIPAAR